MQAVRSKQWPISGARQLPPCESRIAPQYTRFVVYRECENGLLSTRQSFPNRKTAANERSMRAILFLTALLVTQASAKSPKRNAFATIHYEGTANDDGKQCATLPSTPARRHSHTAPLAALWRYRRHPRYHPGATLVVCYCCLLGARPVVWQSTSSVSAP